jgi:hypothetical protein
MTGEAAAPRRSVARGAAVAVIALVVAGCAGFTADPALTLGLDNATDRPVLVTVNGDWVGTFPAGAERGDITIGAHGGPPWRIEVRTDGGLVLVAAEVAEAPATGTGQGAAADTACGEVTVWAGDTRPDVVPPDAPDGSEAPCE